MLTKNDPYWATQYPYSRDNLPPCPERFKHLDGGTRKTPGKNCNYINELSINPSREGGINPFAMFVGEDGAVRLDPDIPFTERWIIVPIEE